MPEVYQNTETKKATVRIETELFNRVTSQLHYGQLTALFRSIYESLDTLLEDDKLVDIVNYIYKAAPLTLPQIKK